MSEQRYSEKDLYGTAAGSPEEEYAGGEAYSEEYAEDPLFPETYEDNAACPEDAVEEPGYPENYENEAPYPEHYRSERTYSPRSERRSPSYEEPEQFSGEQEQYVDDGSYAEPSPAPVRKKKGPLAIIRKRLKKFWRRLLKMPPQNLIIMGGIIVVVLITIILLVVLLPGRKPAAPAEPTPEQIEATEEPQKPEETPFEATPSPTPEITPHPIKGVGVDGKDFLQLNVEAPIVAEIQERLVELGYMKTPTGGYTQKYGPATRTAVQRFQAVNGIKIDGCVGITTYDVLVSDAAKPLQLDRSSDPYLFKDDITAVQERLIALKYMTDAPTGRYGDATITAVKKFQTVNGLHADGIAGQTTLAMLMSDEARDATAAPVITATPAASGAPVASPSADAAAPADTTTADAAAPANTQATEVSGEAPAA